MMDCVMDEDKSIVLEFSREFDMPLKRQQMGSFVMIPKPLQQSERGIQMSYGAGS